MKKVAIPEKMQRFYGSGTMLHPDKEMVESIIKEIPEGYIATIDSICDKLAQDCNTNVTCPMRTTNFVKAVTEAHMDTNTSIPFWRVIRKNHLLINSPFTTICAENLEKEGFRVSQNGKGEFKVTNLDDRLYSFI